MFADPPDNIGTDYGAYADSRLDYFSWLFDCLTEFLTASPIVWLSFNAKHTLRMAILADQVCERLDLNADTDVKPCVQVYTFGQHRQTDLGNNHRPLWRFSWPNAKFYPDQIRVASWRQLNGDKRADPRGRIPGDVFAMQYPDPGDVFDFPRVTGNSKQRCAWHPTQLHEQLVERCILFSTQPGGSVLDPFAGTGTTGRVCDRIGRNSTLIEINNDYCTRMAEVTLASEGDSRQTPTLAEQV